MFGKFERALAVTVALAVLVVVAPRNRVASSNAAQPQFLHGESLHVSQAHTLYRKRGQGPREFKTGSPINNVVVIVMENRTPDNLFAAYYGKKYGKTGLTWGVGQGPNVANPMASPMLAPVPLEQPGDPDHSHLNGFGTEFDFGANDGWASERVRCSKKNSMCATTAFSYVPATETAVYRYIAENFAFADNVFQANEGPSFVAHQYLIAGQSGGIGAGSLTAPFAMAENTVKAKGGGPDDVIPEPGPTAPDPVFAGPNIPDYCQPTTQSIVRTLNMTSTYNAELTNERSNEMPAPCEDYETIFDAMVPNTQPFPWEYHWAGLAFWAAPAAVNHLKNSPNFTSDPGGVNFIKEAKRGTLPALTYVTPCTQDSDHPNTNGNTGPAWVATLLNAIGGNYTQWSQTAVFVTWDDWGGWYDHVPTGHPLQNVYMNGNNPPPNVSDPNEWGYRVPLIAISPWVKQSYVSHTARSYSSILKFIEWNYNLAQLGTDDTFVDDLNDMFDFTPRPVATWVPIPVSPSYKPCS